MLLQLANGLGGVLMLVPALKPTTDTGTRLQHFTAIGLLRAPIAAKNYGMVEPPLLLVKMGHEPPPVDGTGRGCEPSNEPAL
jgi:hypothetical protein